MDYTIVHNQNFKKSTILLRISITVFHLFSSYMVFLALYKYIYLYNNTFMLWIIHGEK